MMPPNLRRGIFAGMIFGTMTLLGGHVHGAAETEPHKINVGLQLYSLRTQMAKDIPGPLALVEGWKIDDVEVASIGKLTPEEFRAELEKHKLKPSGVHFQWDRFSKDLDGIIKDCKALGVDYVTLPWIPHKGDFTPEEGRDAAEHLNDWGKKLAENGLKLTYHPHGYEFRPVPDGGTIFDQMAAATKPEYVNFELDIFWCYDGGMDPVRLMEKYPTRFPQMHLKDMDKSARIPNYTGHENVERDVALGVGQLDIHAILDEAVKIGVKHYYIEDESSRSEEQIPKSIEYVRSVGY